MDKRNVLVAATVALSSLAAPAQAATPVAAISVDAAGNLSFGNVAADAALRNAYGSVAEDALLAAADANGCCGNGGCTCPKQA